MAVTDPLVAGDMAVIPAKMDTSDRIGDMAVVDTTNKIEAEDTKGTLIRRMITIGRDKSTYGMILYINAE